ncbi:MAG TPA: zinc ribbon domain-containing protein [Planctomycetota bacterium]|nr:zinc ribbon domain-containing protein [Planctomycetota bacterium]
MPTYEYACAKCGIVEVFQSMKDEALTKCPQCKRGKVTRLFSGGAGLIFKGSGFWETDYNRSSDYKSKAKADEGGSGSSDNASEPPPASKAKPATKKVDDASAPAPAAPAPAKPAGPARPAGPTKRDP